MTATFARLGWIAVAAAAMSLSRLFECARHSGPLRSSARQRHDDAAWQKGHAAGRAVFVRIFKEESELEIWKQRDDGRFYHFKTYPICTWSGELGPKLKHGDKQAPEGFYSITPVLMNPNSKFYLSFNLGYPNSYDKAWGRTGDICDGAWQMPLCGLLRHDRRNDGRDLWRDAGSAQSRARKLPGPGAAVPHVGRQDGRNEKTQVVCLLEDTQRRL